MRQLARGYALGHAVLLRTRVCVPACNAALKSFCPARTCSKDAAAPPTRSPGASRLVPRRARTDVRLLALAVGAPGRSAVADAVADAVVVESRLCMLPVHGSIGRLNCTSKICELPVRVAVQLVFCFARRARRFCTARIAHFVLPRPHNTSMTVGGRCLSQPPAHTKHEPQVSLLESHQNFVQARPSPLPAQAICQRAPRRSTPLNRAPWRR